MLMNSSRRGPYTTHACAWCRSKKRKCDGVEPVCGLCQKRGGNCVWGESATEQYGSKRGLNSLQHRIQILEKEICHLRNVLSQCTCSAVRGLSTIRDLDAQVEHSHNDEDTSLENLIRSDPQSNESDASDVDELIASTKRLVIESDKLRLYGPTSAFGFDPIAKSQTCVIPAQCPLSPADEGTYVLYSDDNIDWDRHIPKNLLSRREHDHLLDVLFRFVMSWTLRIVPHLFFRDMYRSLSSPHVAMTEHYSPMLHNALLAYACSFSENPNLHAIQTRNIFLKNAKIFLDSECDCPTISVVQALDVIGSCHSTQAQQTLGYMYSGMAGRICQALGLGVYSKDWIQTGKVTEEYLSYRNWSYWSYFCSDIFWFSYVGRDFCLPEPEDDMRVQKLKPPAVSTEIDTVHWNWSHLNVNVLDQPCRTSSIFVVTCELMRVGRKVLHFANAWSRYEQNHKIISKLDSQLRAWKASLSPDLDVDEVSRVNALPHRLVMHLVYWWLFTVLHRPFYNRRPPSSTNHMDHIQICEFAMGNIMTLLEVYDNLYSVRHISTALIQVMFSAGTVAMLSTIRASSGPRISPNDVSYSLSQADKCFKYLNIASKSFEGAADIKRILENMRRVWVAPRVNIMNKEVGRADGPSDQAAHPETYSSTNTAISPESSISVQDTTTVTLLWQNEMLLNPYGEQQFFAFDQSMNNPSHPQISGSEHSSSISGNATQQQNQNQGPYLSFNWSLRTNAQSSPATTTTYLRPTLGPQSLYAGSGWTYGYVNDGAEL